MENTAINSEIATDYTKSYENTDTNATKEVCPVCGGELTPLGHCRMCQECYWSACEL